MEPLTIFFDELKRLAGTAYDLAHGLLNSSGRSPIGILKRLQREAFSDIMKLRDRQDKVERLLTYYKSSKGSPFQESSTHVRGNVDLLGAFFIMNDVDEQKYDAIRRSGIRNGIDARLRFETDLREKDKVVAEFLANGRSHNDMLGSPLSLAKVVYAAHFSDWFSAVAIPMGAECRDIEFPTTTHQPNGGAIGITMRKMNIVASMARFVSDTSSTFGQIVWQLSRNTKLSLLGVQRDYRTSGQNSRLGSLAFPIGIIKRNRLSETFAEEDGLISRPRHNSISLMFNSEVDESAKIGGWIETNYSYPGDLQWAVTISDTPEDELGWGLTVGGLFQGPKNLEHFQVETFLNATFGKRFTVQPGFAYVKDGVTQFPSLMIRSSWSL